MLSELINHWKAYLILIVGLVSFATGFSLLSHQVQAQQLLIVGAGVFYFLWGLCTHRASRRITRQVVLEYLAISILGLIAVILLQV